MMKTRITNFLRRVLPSNVKIFAKTLFGMPLSKIHSDWAILSGAGPESESHIVFDLGARNGWFLMCWKDWCPNARIHAFEPDHIAYQALKAAFSNDESIVISPLGIGDCESKETFYYMPGSSVSSSFLEHDEEAWNKLKFETGDIEQRELEITTLDNYIASHSIDSIYLIKIDIQGYELRALKGATRTLTHTRYVLVESGIQPLYKNAPIFTQVYEFMVSQGFHLMNFRAWHEGNDVLMETDMLFRRNDLAPEVGENSKAERKYINAR